MTLYEKNDHSFGKTVIDCFITIMLQHMHCSLGSNIWQNTCYTTLLASEHSDIAPYNFWLLSRLKMLLKRYQFDDAQMVKTNATKTM